MKTWVISGASGYLGRYLVDRLSASNNLILLGRDVVQLRGLFPDKKCMSNYEFLSAPRKHDVFLNLAVLNNDQDVSEDLFKEVNVDLLKKFIQTSQDVQATVFINFNSFHALDDSHNDPYSKTKREGIKFIEKQTLIEATNVFLPLVYANSFSGKLKFLNHIPRFFRNKIFLLIKPFYPVVSVTKIADFLTSNSLHFISPKKKILIADNKNLDGIYRFARRVIDLVFALAVGVLFSWLLCTIFLLIKATSTGSPIFSQPRIGLHGNSFNCFKFRTMHIDTPTLGTHEVKANSVTTIGKFLRSSKLDELPQIFNLLNGSMSLVGPRPCLPNQATLINARKKLGVFDILPGITGLAQLKGVDMSEPAKLASIDYIYIHRRGLFLDLLLIFQTFLGKGNRDGIKK